MSEFEIHPPQHELEVGFEDEGENIRKIIIIGILGFAIFITILAFMDDLFAVAREDEIQTVDWGVQSAQLQEMHTHESEILHSYKLLDPEKAIYRVPIDRAMRLVAEESFQE